MGHARSRFALSLRLADAATSSGSYGASARWSAATALAAVLGLLGLSLSLGLALSLMRAATLQAAGATPGAALGGAFVEIFSILVVVLGVAALTLRAAIVEPLARCLEALEAGAAPLGAFPLAEAARLATATQRIVAAAAGDARAATDAQARDYEARLAAARGSSRPSVPFPVLEALGAAARGDLTLRLSGEAAAGPAAERYDQAVALMTKTLVAFAASLAALRDGGARADNIFSRFASEVCSQAAVAEAALGALAEAAKRTAASAAPIAQAAEALRVAGAQAGAQATTVKGAASSFRAISNAGHEIASTAELIDELAFQTSLLALNAGVEAARFGEAGRGIAVVAQELRAFSQRATQAARASGALVVKFIDEADRGAAALTGAEVELAGFGDHATTAGRQLAQLAAGLAEHGAAERADATAHQAFAQLPALRTRADEELRDASAQLDALVAQLSALLARFRLADPASAAHPARLRTTR